MNLFPEFRPIVGSTLNVGLQAFGLWLSSWAIRKRGEFDRELDRPAKIVRWGIVILSFAIVGQLPGPGHATTRIVALGLGLALLCWPNFAYHLTLQGRRNLAGSNKTQETK